MLIFPKKNPHFIHGPETEAIYRGQLLGRNDLIWLNQLFYVSLQISQANSK
jgi:hypothetical protein